MLYSERAGGNNSRGKTFLSELFPPAKKGKKSYKRTAKHRPEPTLLGSYARAQYYILKPTTTSIRTRETLEEQRPKRLWSDIKSISVNALTRRCSRSGRVNNPPDRVEPRAVKRRPKKQIYLNEPRPIAKARLLGGV